MATDELVDPLIPRPPKLHQAPNVPVADVISSAMEAYVGKMPGDKVVEEGKFVGWPGAAETSSDALAGEAAVAAAKTLARLHVAPPSPSSSPSPHSPVPASKGSALELAVRQDLPRLVRREADSPASSPVAVAGSLVEAISSSGLLPCTLGEDYRGAFCNYTEEHTICAKVDVTKAHTGSKNFFNATGQKYFPSSGNGWDCISMYDYDTYTRMNDCILAVNCQATMRSRTCAVKHKNGTAVIDDAQRCIVENCAGNCGQHLSD